MTNQAIGERVGLTPGPTHSRIKRLKEEGIVRGVHANLDWHKLGYEFFATVDVKVEQPYAEETQAGLAQIPNVWNLSRIKHPANANEVLFRFWCVSDSRQTFFEGFTDVQIQEVELIERQSEIVNVGRVVLGASEVPVWSPSSGSD